MHRPERVDCIQKVAIQLSGVSYETRDGVRMRVVYQPAVQNVITAFPDDAPIPTYKPIK